MKVGAGVEAGISQLCKVKARLSMQSGGDVQAFKPLYQSLRIPILVVTAQPENSQKLYQQLLNWCAFTQVKLFPETDEVGLNQIYRHFPPSSH